MSDFDRIIAKIRKLFAMANHAGSNEQEAETALRQAEALLRKHNLSMTDITPEEAKSDVRESVMHKYKWTPGRSPVWANWLSVEISKLTDTYVMWVPAKSNDSWVKRQQCNLCYVGGQADVITAGEMFDYLFQTINRLCDEYFEGVEIPPTKGKTYKNSYRYGVVQRLSERMKEMIRDKEAEFQQAAGTGTSLVVVKQDAIAAHLGKQPEDLGYQRMKRQQDLRGQHQNAGYRDGGGISLNKQLGTGGTGLSTAKLEK